MPQRADEPSLGLSCFVPTVTLLSTHGDLILY